MITVFKPVEVQGVTIDKAWNWTVNSTYKEQRIFGGQFVNIWTYKVGKVAPAPYITILCLLTQTV